MNFHWPILGHSEIKKYLQHNLDTKHLGQAYLFYGPECLGKKTMAKYCASSLLCQSKSDKIPCQQCPACLQINKNIHSDLILIDNTDDKKSISIEQIRELQHNLSLKSFINGYRIIIINNAHALTEEANNALLKTLEEPNKNVIFFIISPEKNLLPPTIVSRCQSIQFNPISMYKIENWLITFKNADKKSARIYALYANGKPGQAIKLFDSHDLLKFKNNEIDELISIINSRLCDRFIIVNDLIQRYAKVEVNHKIIKTLDNWLVFFRDILLHKCNNGGLIINEMQNTQVKKLAQNNSISWIIKNLINIIRSKSLLNHSINPRLALENLVLSL